MLNALIQYSLRHRPLILAAMIVILVFGWQSVQQLPVEVLPDMTKPTVTILTECPGLAPEEVESLVTQPIESAVQGVSGLDRLRSNSDVGLSLVFAEFSWNADIFKARQMVQERLQSVLSTLPAQAKPGLTPISSLMGEILLVGIRSRDGSLAPMDLRSLADWTIRRRLQSIAGVAEVLTIGGGVKQIHIQPDLAKMAAYNVTLEELKSASEKASGNATSGYLQAGPQEIMVRNLAMSTDLATVGKTIVKREGDRNILLSDVALLTFAVQPMRGDASIALEKDKEGMMGVVLSIDKAPGVDTLKLTGQIEKALEELKPSLPPGVELGLMFRQGDFISTAINNLKEAIRDGAIMVAIILFLFLFNFRTTVITLLAMPLSFAIALLVFRWFDVSVNSMTLGGLAVAMGMVVDDAIVDVENVWRRLRENAALPSPLPAIEVIARASGEVRQSIFYATVLIVLVFLPLLALQGLEGRLFAPIAIATMVSMTASFVVSLTVIPVLSSLLLRPKGPEASHDGWLVRGMKAFVRVTFLKVALRAPFLAIAAALILLAAAASLYPKLGKEFLPTFNEGSATISLASPPGTSLAQSNEIGDAATRLLLSIDEVKTVGRRAGRAERDDHVMPVSVNEFDVEFHENGRPRAKVFEEIRQKLATLPGTFANVGQPIGHRLSHMLSGVSAKIAVKIFGSDLEVLREKGEQVRDIGKSIKGLTDVSLEPLVPIPQVRIEVDRDRAAALGLTPGDINQQVSSLLGGETVAELREGQRTVDLVIKLNPEWQTHFDKLRQLLIQTPDGQRLSLDRVAEIREAKGPNVINRENTQRRIVISANTSERDLQGLVERWEKEVKAKVEMPEGYFFRFEGEYKARQEASQRLALFFSLVVGVITVLLFGYFRSLSLALQVMLNIPLALIGALAFTAWKTGNISIATLIGFIAVGGVAARNGIMMISHYLHLMKHEGEGFTPQMIIRGTLERLVPVLMTALSAGIALVPLVLSADEPGKEILHPVAVAITGGLISSTLLDLLITPAVFFLFGRKAAEQSLRLEAPAAQ